MTAISNCFAGSDYKEIFAMTEKFHGQPVPNLAQQPKKKNYRKFEIVLRDPSEIMRVLSLVKTYYNQGKIIHYGDATHDKDIYTRGVDNPDEIPAGKHWGDLKDKHTHIGFVWYTTATFGTIANKFGVLENSVERIKSPRFIDYLAYLTHSNAPEKHQYSDLIVDTDIDGWRDQRDAILDAKKMKHLETLFPHYLTLASNGQIKRRDIGKELPTELYATHSSSFDKAFTQAEEEDVNMRQITNNVNKIVYFITGCSGSGKTTYAKLVAQKNNWNYFMSGSGNDLLDGYKNEDCLILDDVRGRNFEYEELLHLLDNNDIREYKSRYHNKKITSKCVIVTTIQSYDEFIKELPDNESEDSYQIDRRVSIKIDMNDTKMHIFKFITPTAEEREQGKKGYYEDLGTKPNPVQKFLAKQKPKENRPEDYLVF